MRPVCRQRQLAHPAADLRGMPAQGFDPTLIVRSFMGIQVGRQDRLRIDDDLPSARQPHDHVGTEPPILAGHAFLFEEIAMIDHPCQLSYPLQCNFTPLTADRRRAEGLDQVAGLLLETLMGLRQRFQVLIQPAISRLARLFE